jgi:hypothetical protein
MDPVMLIEQIDSHGHAVLRQRLEGAGAECRIGRDLASDIVVDDEHAAPQHALLTLLEDGRVRVQDLGTRNGTRLRGKRIPAEGGAVVEQAEIIVGTTRIRVRTRHSPLPPERVFRRDYVRRHRTPLATVGVMACMAFGVFLQWLNAPSSLLPSLAKGALVALAVIAVWTTGWALMTKLNRGSWNVRVHATIASIGAAFCVWGYWVAGLVSFAAQWSFLIRVGIAVVALTVVGAIYLHLREATYYGRRIALALAAAVTLLIGISVWLVRIGMDDYNVNRVALGPDVRLGARRVVPNRDIADYLAEVDELRIAAARERQKSLLNAPLADAED